MRRIAPHISNKKDSIGVNHRERIAKTKGVKGRPFDRVHVPFWNCIPALSRATIGNDPMYFSKTHLRILRDLFNRIFAGRISSVSHSDEKIVPILKSESPAIMDVTGCGGFIFWKFNNGLAIDKTETFSIKIDVDRKTVYLIR